MKITIVKKIPRYIILQRNKKKDARSKTAADKPSATVPWSFP